MKQNSLSRVAERWARRVFIGSVGFLSGVSFEVTLITASLNALWLPLATATTGLVCGCICSVIVRVAWSSQGLNRREYERAKEKAALQVNVYLKWENASLHRKTVELRQEITRLRHMYGDGYDA